MKVVRHNTAAEFLAKAGDWLERAEAENNLILGIAAFFASYSGQVKVEPYLLTAQDDEMIVAAALMTPPHRLLITRMPHPAVTLLVEHLLAEGASVPGVLGPRECARLFAENWVGRTGSSSRLKMRERIYACESVLLPILSRGDLRTATRDDEPLLIEWAGEFCREAKIEDETIDTQVQIPTIIAQERLHVWDDGQPVSMADLRRETAHGIAVSLVYTPPRWRNKGYASSCVASLQSGCSTMAKDFAAFLPTSPIQPQTASIRESAMAKFATSMIGSLSKIFFSCSQPSAVN